MEPTPVSRILSRLALWLAILTFTTHIEALPKRPAPNTLADHPMAGAMPNQSKYPIFQQNEGISFDEDSDSLSQAVNTSRHDSSAEVEKHGSPFYVPCLHGISSAHSLPLDPTDNLCTEPLESQQRFGLRFGRRMRTRNSMLGDFDGLMVDYGLGNFALNGIAGFPAVSGKDEINPKNQLFGFSAGSGKLAKAWDLSGYFMELQGSNQDHRSALGGAIRYSQTDRSLLISADYDMLNHTLSKFIVSSAWKLLPTTTLSTTIDIQQSYLPTPQKNYLQQTIALTDGWKWGLPLERINVLSTDSSTDVAAFGFSVTHALAQNIKLDSDIAILNVSNEDDSNNLAASVSDFNEYYFYLKLTGKDMLFASDNSSVTLRHNVSETSRLSSSLLDGSYAIARQWHITPRLQIDYRDNQADNSIQWFASPAVKVEYRWHKQSQFNFNAAGEWTKRQDSADEEYQSSYVVSLGYRTDF